MKNSWEPQKNKNLNSGTIDPARWNAVPNSILTDSEISVDAKVTYAMFLSYAWNNDSCFPGRGRLAEDIGISRTQVTPLIAELEKAGLVIIQRRGQGKTNIYTIHRRKPRAADQVA